MITGLPAPASEAELLTQLPPSHRAGVLRRDLLPAEERVLYETRPSLGALYWGRLTFIGFWLALFLGLGLSSPVALPGGIVLSVPVILWLIIVLLQWRGRVYALTDRRVLLTSGVRGTTFEEASYAQIRNLALEPGYGGGLRFDTTPPVGLYQNPAHVRPRAIKWVGLSDGPRVYTFVQSAFAVELRRASERAATEALVGRLTADSITCAFCGGMIALDQMDRTNPKCPRCGAPILLPS